MRQTFHIIATCAKQKTKPVPREAMFRAVRGRTLKERHADWCSRVKRFTYGVEVRDLYCGDHWSIARKLPEIVASQGGSARLWVISTGFGLVSAEETLPPYSATFSPRHQDAISRDSTEFATWWQLLCKHPPKTSVHPHSLEQLVKRNQNGFFLIVASQPYLESVREDLECAISCLGKDSDLLIISTGTKRDSQLKYRILPVDARWQARLGGTLGSLNVRIARELLVTLPLEQVSSQSAIEWSRREQSKLPPRQTPNRKPSTDADASRFIAQQLRIDRTASFTGLLRRYRDSGWACEHNRFRAIYMKTKGSR